MDKKWIEKYLTEQDTQAIGQAVAAVEKKTSAEVVPLIIRQSTTVTMAGPLNLFLACMVSILSLEYAKDIRMFFAVFAASMFLAYWGRRYWPWLKFLEGGRLEQEVFQRAELEFYRRIYGRTLGRTGVLIFVSVFERKVIVLAEKQISDLVADRYGKDYWQQIVKEILQGVRGGHLGASMVKAIQDCGELLAKDFPVQAGDRNEISNDLVVIH